MRAPQAELPLIAADLLARLRRQRPRVHCITNAVAQTFTANMLLAAGAVPSMTIAAEEIVDFVAAAGALLVNLGTFDAERRLATERAIAAAVAHHRPWVLDPVLIDRSPQRAAFARALGTRGPAAIRCNAAELAALAEDTAEPAAPARYAAAHGVTVGLTGAIDCVTDGDRRAAIANGDPLMARVTAMGCAASALVAAALAVERDAWIATAAALLWLGVAGERAAAIAAGPGTLSVGIVDALYRLDEPTLLTHARVS